MAMATAMALPQPRLFRGVLWRATRQASFYDRRFKDYAARPMHRVSLEHLVKFDLLNPNKSAMLLRSANFLLTALPVRLARRVLDIHALPYICGINPHVQKVHDTYVNIFNELVNLPTIKDLDEEKAFVESLHRQLEQSREILPALARASSELAPHMDHAALTQFLNTMIESRIGRRVLAEQHIAFHHQYYSPEDFCQTDVGSVSMSCDAVAIAKQIFQRASNIAKSTYGCAPVLEISTEGHHHISYIARHLEYMLLELFKNAVRATVEHHFRTAELTPGDTPDLPPVRLHVFSSADQTIFRISDKGGGIPPKVEPHIWDYAFTTIGSQEQIGTTTSGFGQLLAGTPMAGEGFGLPMTRIYARYFGGDLTLQNIPNFGAEMFLKLKHLDRKDYLKQLEEKLDADRKTTESHQEAEEQMA